MSEYELSIIIPHYNSPKLLEKLLDSIGDNPGVEIMVSHVYYKCFDKEPIPASLSKNIIVKVLYF